MRGIFKRSDRESAPVVPTYRLVSPIHRSKIGNRCRYLYLVILSVVTPRKCLHVQSHIISTKIHLPQDLVPSMRLIDGMRALSLHSQSKLCSLRHYSRYLQFTSWISVLCIDRWSLASVGISPR